MKQFISFIKKEQFHIIRDVRTSLILLLIPVLLLLIFGFAITTEINNISFQVLDKSKSEESRRLIEKIQNNNYFELEGYLTRDKEIEEQFKKGAVKLIIIFPSNFSEDVLHGGTTDIQLIVDASRA